MTDGRIAAEKWSFKPKVAIVLLAVTIPLLLGTIGSFGLAFGVGSSCTNEWSLNGNVGLSGSPCSVVPRAVLANSLGQLIAIAAALVCTGASRIWPFARSRPRWWPVVISNPVAVAIYAAATALATSYSLHR